MSNGTRALNVTAEQLELLRISVARRIEKVEGWIEFNAAVVSQPGHQTAEVVAAAQMRLDHWRKQADELEELYQLIENT